MNGKNNIIKLYKNSLFLFIQKFRRYLLIDFKNIVMDLFSGTIGQSKYYNIKIASHNKNQWSMNALSLNKLSILIDQLFSVIIIIYIIPTMLSCPVTCFGWKCNLIKGGLWVSKLIINHKLWWISPGGKASQRVQCGLTILTYGLLTENLISCSLKTIPKVPRHTQCSWKYLFIYFGWAGSSLWHAGSFSCGMWTS